MDKDYEFDLAFAQMRDKAAYYVENLSYCGIGNYFISEQEKFKELCNRKGSRVVWSAPYGYGSLACEVIPQKKNAPTGSFTVQNDFDAKHWSIAYPN